jgi:hypothetical protein
MKLSPSTILQRRDICQESSNICCRSQISGGLNALFNATHERSWIGFELFFDNESNEERKKKRELRRLCLQAVKQKKSLQVTIIYQT